MFEAERVLLAEMPFIPVYTYVTKRLVDPRLRGWESNVMDHHYSKNMFLLKVATAEDKTTDKAQDSIVELEEVELLPVDGGPEPVEEAEIVPTEGAIIEDIAGVDKNKMTPPGENVAEPVVDPKEESGEPGEDEATPDNDNDTDGSDQ